MFTSRIKFPIFKFTIAMVEITQLPYSLSLLLQLPLP
jgi:hypothetical protein